MEPLFAQKALGEIGQALLLHGIPYSTAGAIAPENGAGAAKKSHFLLPAALGRHLEGQHGAHVAAPSVGVAGAEIAAVDA